MDTNNLIKSVIQENIVESKKIATELLLQKLSERLQAKFDEFAPQTFLDEKKHHKKKKGGKKLDPVGKEDEDVNNDGEVDGTDEYLMNRRKAIQSSMAEKGEDGLVYEETDSDELGEDGLVYEDGDEVGEDGLVYEDEDESEENEQDEDEGKGESEYGHEGSGMSAAEENARAGFGKQHQNEITEDAEQLDEVSPPGGKKMTHSKNARKAFKEKYGKRGKSVQYATAWKKEQEEKDE